MSAEVARVPLSAVEAEEAEVAQVPLLVEEAQVARQLAEQVVWSRLYIPDSCLHNTNPLFGVSILLWSDS